MSRPPGPYVRPIIRFDDEGRYTEYPDKNCSAPGCDLPLTSRNRYGQKLLCKDHGREKEREREAKRPPRVATPKKPKTYSTDPEKHAVHAALARWLAIPISPGAADKLRAAMVDFELRYRLRELLPDVAAPQAPPTIPVEEVTFTNPEHRTTRTEFLSDCETYGV